MSWTLQVQTPSTCTWNTKKIKKSSLLAAAIVNSLPFWQINKHHECIKEMTDKKLAHVAERNYFTCPGWESNPGGWIYRQTLYHDAVKAGFYHKAVEVYLYIPRPSAYTPSNLKFIPEFLGTGITWNETMGDIYTLNCHRVGYLPWAPLS